MRCRQHYAAILMAAALLLPSCSQDEDAASPRGADEAGQALTISTRAAEGAGAFDSFRLYLFDAATNTVAEEHLLTWDVEACAWLENGKPPVTELSSAIANAVVCDDSDLITFDNELNADGTKTVTCRIPTDQTDAEKSAAAGKLMFAMSEWNRGEPLSLTFQRACAKLVFLVDTTAVTEAGGEGKLTDINVGAHPEYVYHCYEGNSTDGYYKWNPEDKCNVTCFLADADAKHGDKPYITAYIGYRSCEAEEALMTLKVDGIPRSVKIGEAFDIVPGYEYTFDLTVTPKEITATVTQEEGNDISGWDKNNETEL